MTRIVRIIVAISFIIVWSLGIASAQVVNKTPAAEMLKNFPTPIYTAAQKADSTWQKAQKQYDTDMKAMMAAELELRKAIANETDAAKFAAIQSKYILAAVIVSTSGVDVISADADVTSEYLDHFGENGSNHDTFMKWMEVSMVRERTFDPETGNDKRLLDAALVKFKKLIGNVK